MTPIDVRRITMEIPGVAFRNHTETSTGASTNRPMQRGIPRQPADKLFRRP